MTALFENPLIAVALGTVAITAALVVFSARRSSGALAGLIAAVLLTALLITVERLVVTEREEIEASLVSVMAAVEANDLAGVLSWIDPNAGQVIRDAQEAMPLVEIDRARAGGTLRIEFDDATAEPSARSEFQGVVSGTVRQGGMRIGYFDRVVVDWARRGDRWLITGYTAYDDGRPIDAVSGVRGPRVR